MADAEGTYEQDRRGKAGMRIAIIGNCQVTGLKRIFKSALPEAGIEVFPVWEMPPPAMANLIRTVPDYDLVITQPLMGPQYAELWQSLQNDVSAPMFRIHNLYWNALTPDCCYVRLDGRPIKSPVMNYHSRQAFDAYLAGRSVPDAMKTFGRFSAQAIEEAWEKNRAEFAWRESMVDIPFLQEMTTMLSEQKCFHVFNHPTIGLLKAYAAKILETALPEVVVPDRDIPDELGALGSFPVTGDVAEHLGLPYSDPAYQARTEDRLVRLEPEEFVERSYELYELYGREQLSRAVPG